MYKYITIIILMFLSTLCYSQTVDEYIKDGLVKMESGKYQEAVVDFTEAIKLDSTDANTYYLRGKAIYKLEDCEGAILDYNRVLELDPQFTKVYYNRGLARYDCGYPKEAIQDYDKVIEEDSTNAKAYFFRGGAKFDLKDDSGGCVDLKKSKELGYAHDLTDLFCN